MGTLAGSVILSRAQKTLLDETGVQWGPDELIDYLAAGINWIVLVKPDAYVKHEDMALAVGDLQQGPSGCVQVLDVDSNTTGETIRQIERNDLDHSKPNWRASSNRSTVIRHFMIDRRSPQRFYVEPPAAAGASVRVLYSATPPRYTNASTPLPVDDLYENPLHWFVVGMAYLKNSKRGDMNKGNAYMTMAANAIGAKAQVQAVFNPLPSETTPDGQGGR